MEYTPEKITRLGKDEIFVFGSNLAGLHRGGAARVARERFGALMGHGVGLQGQSYAIPTMQGCVETIRPYVDEFIRFARKNYNLKFYVTRIGCGIAGFTDSEIAPLFAEAMDLYNVVLPESFVKEITQLDRSYLPDWTAGYTSYDMMIDFLLTANRIFKYTEYDADKAIDRLKGNLGGYIRGVAYVSDASAFMNNDAPPSYQLIERQLREATDHMEIQGLLTGPVQRFSLMLEAEIARLLLDITGGNPKFFPIGWHDTASFGYSVVCILTGRWNCGDNRYLQEDVEKALIPVEKILLKRWKQLCVDGRLDEKRLLELFSAPSLWHEWHDTARHSHALYRWFDNMLEQMWLKPESSYRKGIDSNGSEYFVPRHDMSAPVFKRLEGRVRFPNIQLKKAFIKGLCEPDIPIHHLSDIK